MGETPLTASHLSILHSENLCQYCNCYYKWPAYEAGMLTTKWPCDLTRA